MSNLSADRVRKLDSLVHNWLPEADIPGASVVVFDTDGELYAEGFGARDLESNAPATPETLYGVGSITKPITIAELLSHTSGMPTTSAGLLSQAVEGYPAGVADEADRERLVREATELRVTDRERFFYYNTGYDVLGRVIESVDGRTYAEYIQEELMAPLGMHRATFHRESFESDDDQLTATVERDRGGIAVTISESWGEEEFTAYPETLAPDDHTFYTRSRLQRA
ncbi:MAG: serine hydrolase domain-containing protein [Halolamina sp.]|uniref:serine hydrolase domain-containing protein n=1 Tax=Halolamina sp. TaxID=1940283 RepID=UPI002FC39116